MEHGSADEIVIAQDRNFPLPDCRPDYITVVISRSSGRWVTKLLARLLLHEFRAKHKWSTGGIRNNYDFSERCYLTGEECAAVAWGGNGGGTCITLTGAACERISQRGWAYLHWFARRWSGHITRLDLAGDFFGGESCVRCLHRYYEQAPQQFRNGGVRLAYHWYEGREYGSTFQLGMGGRIIRFYERGKKLGDAFSLWVRAEAQLRDTDCHIPLDAMLPENWWPTWAAQLPVLRELRPKVTPAPLIARPRAQHPTFRATFRSSVIACGSQWGKFLGFCREIFGDKLTLDLVSHGMDWGQLERFPDWKTEADIQVMLTAAARALVAAGRPETRGEQAMLEDLRAYLAEKYGCRV